MSADEGDITFVETTPADDVIKGRSPRTPMRWAHRPWWLVVLVLVVLAAGIGIGYVLGRHTSKAASSAPPPTPAGSVLSELPRLTTTGPTCSMQPPGTHRLLLGAQVQNGETAPIQFHYVRGIFPMAGLRMVDAEIGNCRVPGVPVPDSWLAPGGTAWLRLTVDVLMPCPQPAPVHFQVDYAVNGAPTRVTLAVFPDLGSVTYSGCR